VQFHEEFGICSFIVVRIKPSKATDYDICVKAKDSSGKIIKKYLEVKVNEKLKNTSAVSAAEIVKGNTVTVNCSATGGVGVYRYQVLYKQTSQSMWTTAQDFGENAEVTFKPSAVTTYDVCVKVRDKTGKTKKLYFTVKVNERLYNTSTISHNLDASVPEKAFITKGESVTVNGSATGGVGEYTYAVLYKQKAQSKWTTKQDFDVNNTISVKPTKATNYDICVKVKDTNGTIVKKYFTVNVTE